MTVASRVLDRLRAVGHIRTWHPSRADRVAARVRRPLDRLYLSRTGGLRLHATLGESCAAQPEPGGGPRILLTSLRAWPDHNAYELVVAEALRARGATVALLTCGGGMPKCEVGWARSAYPRPCDRCGWFTDRLHDTHPHLGHYRLRDGFPWGADATAAPAEPAGTAGPATGAARVSLAWSLRTSDPGSQPEGPAAARDYQVAITGVREAGTQILDDFRPDVVVLLNGLFAAETELRGLCRERSIRVVTHEIAPRAGALVLAQDGLAPDYDTGPLWDRVRDRPLTDDQARRLDAMIGGRAEGVGAHESYFDAPVAEATALRAALGVPDGARVVSLFTNLSWDSAALGHDVAWPSMLDWIEDAVRQAAQTPGTYLVVRVHPAEVRWGTREYAREHVVSRLGRLPENVRFVDPDKALSSYGLLAISDLVLTYTSTVGLEAVVRGVPVAVAGDVHYRGKGFTHDLARREELGAVLREVGGPLSPELVDSARRYAFTFFFRAMVPFALVERTAVGGVARMPATARELAPGRDPYLDHICDRVLDGGAFDVTEALA